MFGVYLSNHPVTSYKANFSNVISLNEVQKYLNRRVNFIVVVDKARVINTKKGEEMMFVIGSDEYQSMDFTLFPKTYTKYRELQIKVGDIIKIFGNIEKRYDEFQVIVDEIEVLNKK